MRGNVLLTFKGQEMLPQAIQERGNKPTKRCGESEWKILAEEASLEQDPDKLLEIVRELTHALDEAESKNKKSA